MAAMRKSLAVSMEARRRTPSPPRIQEWFLVLLTSAFVVLPGIASRAGIDGGARRNSQG